MDSDSENDKTASVELPLRTTPKTTAKALEFQYEDIEYLYSDSDGEEDPQQK
jgi:hypothetical protein